MYLLFVTTRHSLVLGIVAVGDSELIHLSVKNGIRYHFVS